MYWTLPVKGNVIKTIPTYSQKIHSATITVNFEENETNLKNAHHRHNKNWRKREIKAKELKQKDNIDHLHQRYALQDFPKVYHNPFRDFISSDNSFDNLKK